MLLVKHAGLQEEKLTFLKSFIIKTNTGKTPKPLKGEKSFG
jgi:hypothetical protein